MLGTSGEVSLYSAVGWLVVRVGKWFIVAAVFIIPLAPPSLSERLSFGRSVQSEQGCLSILWRTVFSSDINMKLTKTPEVAN